MTVAVCLQSLDVTCPSTNELAEEGCRVTKRTSNHSAASTLSPSGSDTGPGTVASVTDLLQVSLGLLSISLNYWIQTDMSYTRIIAYAIPRQMAQKSHHKNSKIIDPNINPKSNKT